jgi:5,6-dimethylbenzimidazole synthase
MNEPESNNRPEFSERFRTNLRELFRWRRDVRRFRGDPLPKGALDHLLATACLAPSVGLSEPWRFVIVNEPSRRGAIRACFDISSYRPGGSVCAPEIGRT